MNRNNGPYEPSLKPGWLHKGSIHKGRVKVFNKLGTCIVYNTYDWLKQFPNPQHIFRRVD
jgi:hypothetical protein